VRERKRERENVCVRGLFSSLSFELNLKEEVELDTKKETHRSYIMHYCSSIFLLLMLLLFG
jgi:hypothetical protein